VSIVFQFPLCNTKVYKGSKVLQELYKKRRWTGAWLRNSFGGELGTWKMIMLIVFGNMGWITGRHLYEWFKGNLVIEIQMLIETLSGN
jgi:hypothetical protein